MLKLVPRVEAEYITGCIGDDCGMKPDPGITVIGDD